MRNPIKNLLLILLCLFASHARAEVKSDCGQSTAGQVPYSWCIYQDSAGQSGDILYYMHGGGGSEKSWESKAEKFNQSFRALGVPAPKVISFSFGENWLLGDVATSEHPALLPLVMNSVFPALEEKAGGLIGRRLVMGISMGGYNAAELALRAPGLFAKAAPLCAGMLPLSFDATEADVKAFLAKSSPKVDPSYLNAMLEWVRSDFGDAAVWARHDPLALARKAYASAPSFYVTANWDDLFGFYLGSKAFVEILRSRGASVEWHPVKKGGHCVESKGHDERIARFFR